MLSGWLNTCLVVMRSAPPSSPHRDAAPPFELARDRFVLPHSRPTERHEAKIRVHRVNYPPSPIPTGHNASALILDELEYRPCLDGSPVAQRRGNVSTLRRVRNGP